LGGFIQVSNKTIPPHSFSLNNYREIWEDNKTDIYFSIINPWKDMSTFEK
jgi:hypothetical protein